jgi:metal-sulfur cluster biosynthetic enzyme
MPDTASKPNEAALIREALKEVIDPHVGMSVVDMGMVREITPGEDDVQIKMILTSPFCPLASMIVSQVQRAAERVVDRPVKVDLLKQPWSPAMTDEQGSG